MTAEACLIVEGSGEADLERARTALAALKPSSLIVVPPPSGGPLALAAVRPIVALAQANGVAALILGDAALAKAAAADGVHLAQSPTIEDDYVAARKLLGSSMIVGADAGASRHEAMCLGEAGADYVAFSGGGTPDPRATRLDLATWWADVFEIPGVALDVATVDEAEALAATGIDFVAVRVPAGESPASVRDWAGAMAGALEAAG